MDIWVLMHSQHSEDNGLFCFHIGPLEREIEANLADAILNNRKKNKWQVVHIGGRQSCNEKMDELIKLKGLGNK